MEHPCGEEIMLPIMFIINTQILFATHNGKKFLRPLWDILSYDPKKFKIIGYVFTNPELLEKK